METAAVLGFIVLIGVLELIVAAIFAPHAEDA